MNRINQRFQTHQHNLLSVYYTAGYPDLHSTLAIAQFLEQAGADFIEIGMPYSDPLADGPTIQKSSKIALDNGMSLQLLFEQLADLRKSVTVPVVLMGYLNPILQYGVEAFCQSCQQVGVDGLIIPDLPMAIYKSQYASIFEQYGVKNIFLISPQTSKERIREIDAASNAFIYAVSSSSTTGVNQNVFATHNPYFDRIGQLKNPALIGFGIADREGFQKAGEYARGAIIGSAFIKMLAKSNHLEDDIRKFVQDIKPITLSETDKH